MKIPLNPLLLALLISLPTTFFVGCNTVTTSGAAAEPVEIKLGMSSVEVLAELGKPAEVKDLERDGALLEVWVYKYTRQSQVDMKQTGTYDVPYIDPITGRQRMIQEPTLMPEITKVLDTFEIVFANEQVVSWNQKREHSRKLVE